MNKIYLIVVYARSGGTLLNRCLGVSKDAIILSELNPLGSGSGQEKESSPMTVRAQAKKWYSIDIEEGNYIQEIEYLLAYCSENNLKLIIRDWSFVGFKSLPQNEYLPSMTLNNYELLNQRFDVEPIVFIRNTFDVWLSMKKPLINDFYESYLAFINAIVKLNCEIYCYEDLVNKSEETLLKICNSLDIKYNDDLIKHFSNNMNVLGDLQNWNSSTQSQRGLKLTKIEKLERRKINRRDYYNILNLKISTLNHMLGYPCNYFHQAEFERLSCLQRTLGIIEKINFYCRYILPKILTSRLINN